MLQSITGIVLAGGHSRRMGHNKALLELAGRPMVEIVVERLRAAHARLDQVIIAASDADRYAPFADRCVPDLFPRVGTLGGIHAGLAAADHDLTVIVGCDMPFLDPAVLGWFVDAAEEYDVVVLRRGEWLEPLHAVYRRRCLPAIEAAIRGGQRRVVSFFDAVRVRTVDPGEIAHLDPDLHSFRNINTRGEWKSAAAEVGRD
jgi:molybdopterin-guanine dinucleotide biosynthesis protein A